MLQESNQKPSDKKADSMSELCWWRIWSGSWRDNDTV
ncbi:Trp operon leader peptide [Vibrio algarum]|uniref:Trp operon leader peptide n=1 Tax=Vibrio algarum TaxID=3020714 RepID=A0ABT4YQ80_9VIBR|nr:Trp operon leader peptide [Vibrio sp. KJ40-1]MDB1123663.1 Trp operon leader peptide [Vibrio sp. KJ40-1]